MRKSAQRLQSEMGELDAFRRKQLRNIIGVHYPRTISNEELYRRCGMIELQYIIRGARWRMLGHTLRGDASKAGNGALL